MKNQDSLSGAQSCRTRDDNDKKGTKRTEAADKKAAFARAIARAEFGRHYWDERKFAFHEVPDRREMKKISSCDGPGIYIPGPPQ